MPLSGKMLGGLRWLKNHVTLEPMIAMLWIAHQIVGGAGITTDLMFLKVCKYELKFNDTVCGNLQDQSLEDHQIQVQKRVNSFEITRDWIGNAPPVFFGLIAGALSDQFGRKPLMFFPLLGCMLATLVPIAFYTFIDRLPLEFMILEEMSNLFGGLGVYFVGSYSYGSSVTKPSERSIVLTRYDGIESVSMIFGAGLSPTVFRLFGFYGNYIVRFVFYGGALAYLSFCVEEPVKDRKKVGKVSLRELPSFFYEYIVKSVTDTVKTYFRKRPDNLRLMLLVQIFVYACYKMSNTGFALTYLYMKLRFEATNADYALLISVLKGLQGFALLAFVPLMSKVLKMHDSLIVFVCTAINSLALLAGAFVDSLWAFLFCRWLTLLRMCQYGTGRSLVTRTVDPDEMGKALSGFTIVSSFVPYFAAPAMRYIYQATLETHPSSYIVVSAALIMAASALNLWLFARHRNEFRNEDEEEKEEEDRK